MRRNFTLLAVDAVFFFITLSLAGHDNVLPLFAAGLTTSAPLIGLVPAIALGLWVVPQVLLAGWVQRQADKWRVMALSMLGRLGMVAITAACFSSPLASRPGVLLTLFLALFAVYMASDGLIVIALADMLPRLLPERERVRLFAVTQVITGLLGLLAGGMVSWALTNPNWPFPRNYGVLLALSSVALLVSAIALLLLPRTPTPTRAPRAAAYAVAWRDQRFRRMVLSQLLSSGVWLAAPFFGVHATQQLALPNNIAGLFVVASSVGYIVASLTLGLIGERRGLHWIIRCGSAVVVTSPLVALAAGIAGHASPPVYALVFVGIGVFNSLRMLGFRNYVFAVAPEELRPTYVGLANGIVGLAAVMPVLGGWLLEATSYSALFALAALCGAAGFGLSLTLPHVTTQVAPEAS
jgi:MFS family permease